MPRILPTLLRLFNVSEICWEDLDTVVYAGTGFGIHRQTLLWTPKAPNPSLTVTSRFIGYYTAAAKLPSGCIVPPIALKHFGQSQGLLLDDVVGRPIKIETSDPRQRVRLSLGYSIAALESLSVLHQFGVVHGRISPINLWATNHEGRVALFDLPVAHEPSVTKAHDEHGHHLGSAYAAPELLRGPIGASAPSVDLFAFGAVLYEWLTGRPPFEDDNRSVVPLPPTALQGAISPSLSSLLLRLLSADPAGRPRDLGSLKAELGSCLEQADTVVGWSGLEREALDGDPTAIPPLTSVFCGRCAEQDLLFGCLDSVYNGPARLVLITGPPGVGKTALAHRLQLKLSPVDGFFVAGKFDQITRSTPYSALAQALSRLASRILAEPEARFATWKGRLSASLGLNAQIVIDLVPEFELILGRHPPVEPLPPAEARNRFHQVFGNLLDALAGHDRPLCIMLDDLQWADAATLELLQNILGNPDAAHVLFIGTCRSTETEAAYSPEVLIDALRRGGRDVTVIVLDGLTEPEIVGLLSNLLKRNGPEVGDLASLLYRQSLGNPFALDQILRHLWDTGLIYYDRGLGEWGWSMRQIWEADSTEDVVSLLRERIRAQTEGVRKTLTVAACLGAVFDEAGLALARDAPIEDIHRHLSEAERLGLVHRATEGRIASGGETYRFAHDRIQHAALALLDAGDVPRFRLEIGRCLLRALPEEQTLAAPFSIAENFNAGAHLLEDQGERMLGVQLNLAAGRISRKSLAYRDALVYLRAGLALLDESVWEANYRLIFDLHTEAFECEYHSMNLERAQQLFEVLIERAASTLDRASVYHTKILLEISSERYAEAMCVGRTVLGELGMAFPLRVRRRHLLSELLRVQLLMLRRSPESLGALGDMSDPALAAASRVLLSLSPGAYFINPNATLLMGLKIVTLSIRNGNSPSSAGGYVLYGLASTAILGNIRVGYAFGELAVTLARRFDNLAVRARVLLIHAGFVAIWRRPFTECLTLLHEAHSTAIAAGDFTYANYAHLQTLFLGIVRSIPLPEYIEECVRMRAFVIRTRDPFAIDNLANWLQSARALQGDTRALAELHSVEFDETAAEQRYRNGSNLTTLGYYLIRKLHLAFLIGDIAAAFRFGNEAERFFGLLPGQVLLAEHALYFGLTLVEMRRVRFAPATLLRLARCRKRLRHWATHAPENYRPMYLLLDAESETLKGMASRALPMFDAAIDSAREGGFHNIEALSAERAARFCLRVEQSHAASAYFDEAIKAYRTWGATAKVQQLEDLVASLAGRSSALVSDPTQTVALEEETRVLRSRQRPDDSTSLTSVLQRLIADVLASRDLLRVAVVLRERGIPVVRAAGDRSAISTMREDLEESSRISPAVVTYVLRANEEVVLTSASLEEWFAACPHLRVRRPISILCFPIGSGKQPFGALYAEAGPLVGRGNVTAGQLRIICAAVASKIERARIEESLRHSRQLLHDTARAADSATRVRSHLEKFVPAPVRRLILKNLDAPELQPTDREISVMFIDVEGYTKLSEELDPLVLGKAIERYFSRYLEEIQRHGGAVNQIAGDGLMALFEEPKLHAQQAVNTALAVQRATDEIASAVGADAVPRLRPHIGINSGTVRVGATRMETAASALWTYTAVGPAVNLASRIAGAARGGEILIGRATADLLGGAFELEHLGPQNFKNVQGTTEIARVLDSAYPP